MRINKAYKVIRIRHCLLTSLLLGLPMLSYAATDYELGVQAYQSGQFEAARQYWEQAVNEGNASAAYNLGIALSKGLGGSVDERRAVSLFKRAATAGLGQAAHRLALAYYSGKGVAQNKQKALQWWQRAADQGHARARYNLAAMQWNGDGVEQDQKHALTLFNQAAAAGNARAQAFLESVQAVTKSQSYPDNDTRIPDLGAETLANDPNQAGNDFLHSARSAYTQQDYATALHDWQQAAGAGSGRALYELAHLYQAGLGVNADPQRAFEYIQKAANNGFAAAQFEMGRYYIDGSQTGKNDTLALYWMQSAADQNHDEAQNYIDQLR